MEVRWSADSISWRSSFQVYTGYSLERLLYITLLYLKHRTDFRVAGASIVHCSVYMYRQQRVAAY